MAIAQAAMIAGKAAVQAAPVIIEKAGDLIRKATNGRVQSVSDIVSYVGNDPKKFSVVAGALATAGIPADQLVPQDLVGLNPVLGQIRNTLLQIGSQMRSEYDAGSSRVGTASDSDTAADLLRKRRVEAVLAVYGSADRYFLCHPTGGVPRADFAWYQAMGFRK